MMQSEVLTGTIGLPGVLAMLAATAHYSLQFYKGLKSETVKPETGNHHIVSAVAYRDQVAMTKEINENIDKTRHSINNNMEKMIERLEQSINRQTEAIIRSLDARIS